MGCQWNFQNMLYFNWNMNRNAYTAAANRSVCAVHQYRRYRVWWTFRQTARVLDMLWRCHNLHRVDLKWHVWLLLNNADISISKDRLTHDCEWFGTLQSTLFNNNKKLQENFSKIRKYMPLRWNRPNYLCESLFAIAQVQRLDFFNLREVMTLPSKLTRCQRIISLVTNGLMFKNSKFMKLTWNERKRRKIKRLAKIEMLQDFSEWNYKIPINFDLLSLTQLAAFLIF